MTRLFLAAGVAALAIATPTVAKPGGGGGHGNDNNGGGAPVAAPGGGGGGHGHGNGGGNGGAAVVQGGGGHGHGNAGGGGGFAAPQMQRAERQQMRGPQTQRAERQQFRAPQMQRQQARGFERQQARNVQHAQQQQARGFERQQARNVERQQARGFERQQARNLDRQQLRANRAQQAQSRQFERQQLRANGMQQAQQGFVRQQGEATRFANRNFAGKDAQVARVQQQAFEQQLNASRFGALTYGTGQILAPTVVQQFVGVPVANVPSFASFSPLPATLQYLYPATPDYYYQYGDGYVYQVDRGSNLIDSLIPLLAGGYLPGQYLPSTYMNSYVPSYYGLNSFYPDYGDTCNRYYAGVIYQVDCSDGYVENVVPMYAAGYGVGQMLPSSYAYYNVPYQYRSMYYDTPNNNYWYSPGAIYQYDRSSSMITSVAALLSPGFAVGQQLPLGYNTYNVPYDYRQTYYDTPDAWYRYNNGYIYQVDPTTQLVTAIVASLLT